MKNLKIAVTGGIGSGKSTVCKIIKRLGYPVFSCDEICHDLYKKRRVLRKIKKLFPTAVLGKVFLKADKKTISQLTFNNDENYLALSNLLQPLIVDKLIKEMNKVKGVCFAEVPLLFEGNYQNHFDKVIVVLRDLDERKSSVFARSNLDETTFNAIAKRQVEHDKLDLSGYIVIKNDQSENHLEKTLKSVLSQIN